jgi:hypothetical protein
MQLRKTFFALAILAIVGGLAYYSSLQPAPAKGQKLFSIASSDIEKIEMRGPGRDLVIQRGAPGLWQIVKPTRADAENTTVDAIADAIANLEIIETVDDHPTDLASFGLENPSVTVTVTTRDNRVLPGIEIGGNTPIGGNSYIKTTASPAVLLVAPGFAAQASRSLNDVRSRVLFGFTADQIKRVVIGHADGSQMELVHSFNGWTIVKPTNYPADPAAVQKLLDALATMRIADFADEHPTDLSSYGLAKPSITIELYGDKPTDKESLAIGSKQPVAGNDAVFVRRGEGDRPVCTVASYIVSVASKSLDDLRDETVMRFNPDAVARVTLIGGPVSLVLDRAGEDQWQVRSQGRVASAETVVAESLLSQIQGLKGNQIVEDPMTDPKRYGMVNPNLTATLADSSGKDLGTINLSIIQTMVGSQDPSQKPTRQDTGYATSTADQAVYELPADLVTDLEGTASRLKQDAAPQPSPTPAAVKTPSAAPTIAVATPASSPAAP